VAAAAAASTPLQLAVRHLMTTAYMIAQAVGYICSDDRHKLKASVA